MELLPCLLYVDITIVAIASISMALAQAIEMFLCWLFGTFRSVYRPANYS